MIRFIREPDPNIVNDYGVELSLDNNGSTVNDLYEIWKRFMDACGYVVDWDEWEK